MKFGVKSDRSGAYLVFKFADCLGDGVLEIFEIFPNAQVKTRGV